MFTEPGVPLVNYRFAVVIYDSMNPNNIDARFQEVSGLILKRSVSSEKGISTLGGEPTPQLLTLKRGVFRDDSPLIGLTMEEVEFWNEKMLRKDILIALLDENEDPIKGWVVSEAYLESWQWGNLTGDGKEVLIETMSFSYKKMRFVPLNSLTIS